MPIQIVKNDITKIEVDAIVNAANESLLGGGGVDGAIHRVAGPNLLQECKTLGGCKTGEAKITKGYDLLAKYVIHTVGPIWQGGLKKEKELLISCYQKSLEIARQYHCESIAFPLISSGAYGYPKDQALQVAMDTIGKFLFDNEMQVYIVFLDKKSFQISAKLCEDVKEYIDYCDRQSGDFCQDVKAMAFLYRESRPRNLKAEELENISKCSLPPQLNKIDISNLFENLDESFSQMLFRKIDEKGLSEVACYKLANVDRKLFSKIRSDKDYHPSKQTAVAFAIALKLSFVETQELLQKAGFTLSRSNKFDIIIEYCMRNKIYDIFKINEILFEFDQKLLGF